MSANEIAPEQAAVLDTPRPTIGDRALRDAVAACRRAAQYTEQLAATMGGAHAFAYAIVPASDRGRPCLAIVTGAAEACILTRRIVVGMMTDHLQTAAWYGALPVILRVDPHASEDEDVPLAAIHLSALPISACGDRRHMVKLRGLHRAADGKFLVLTRRSPWTCLPNARVAAHPLDSSAREDRQ